MCGNTTYFVPFIASISTIIGVLIGAFLARNTAFKIVDRQEKNRDYLALRNTFIPVLKILKEPGVPERQKIPTFFDDQDIAMLSFVGHLAGEAKGNFNAKWNEYEEWRRNCAEYESRQENSSILMSSENKRGPLIKLIEEILEAAKKY